MTQQEMSALVAQEVERVLAARLAPPRKQFYRAATVARMLDVTKTTVWRWSAQGILPPAIKLGGGCTVFDAAAVDEVVARMKGECHEMV